MGCFGICTEEVLVSPLTFAGVGKTVIAAFDYKRFKKATAGDGLFVLWIEDKGIAIMGKRVNRVQFHLDTGSVKQLSAEEIATILRAADELIDSGGRTMLVKILKGSRDKKLLELGLDQCPAYGFYNKMTMTEIGFRVDWMIRTKTGWEIEKRTYAQELYDQLCKAAGDNDEQFIVKLKEHTNRQVIWIILDLIKEKGTPDMVPFIQKWKEVEVRKIREGIDKSIQSIWERS